MKRLILASAAATMVALSVPANAQRISVDHIYRPGGPYYYYDSVDRTYYGGVSPPHAKVFVVTPRARTSIYDGPPYRYGYRRGWDAAYPGYAYSGPYVGYRSWDGRDVTFGDGYRYRGWWPTRERPEFR